MNSKQKILSAIRSQEIAPVDLPSLENHWIQYPDPYAKFAESVEGVGGEVVACRNFADVRERLQSLAPFQQANRVYCEFTELQSGNVDLHAVADSHDLSTLDFAVFHGQFGVAENGAVWLSADNVRHRVAYVITQHLAIVIPGNVIVHNMHEAYQRLRFDRAHFGMFMSGPSKTADIEQSLVIGAHGARSLTIYTTDTDEHGPERHRLPIT